MTLHPRTLRLRPSYMLLAAALCAMAAGCAFDTNASGVECDREGAVRGDEVCTDGIWRVPGAGADADTAVADAADTATDAADTGPPVDTGSGDTGSVDTSPADADASDAADVCTPLSEAEICEQSTTCGQVTYDNCGTTVTVDCSSFIDFDTSQAHCGGCNQPCQPPHAQGECVGGECTLAADPCEDGYYDVDGRADNGCEYQCNGDASADETCDNGDDDNCDGSVDEGCDCTTGDQRQCYTGPAGTRGEGLCRPGTQSCTGGRWGSCENQALPTAETCNGDDDDCDGRVDEAIVVVCPLQHGVCAGAQSQCINGGFTACDTAYGSDYEVDEASCDGLDNDCDGSVDEGCQCDYQSDSDGVCAQASLDTAGTCQPPASHEAGDESSCDGLDNDCDGAVDEGLVGACPKQDGVCSGSAVSCANGSYPSCGSNQYGPNYEFDEQTCDGLDNDCDGQTDEGLTQACPLQDGVCAGSAVACSGGSFGTCGDAEYGADYEAGDETSCDGHDNDCDGSIDEGLIQTFYRDADGDGFGDLGVSVNQCSAPAGYVANGDDCADTDKTTYPGAPEVCNGNQNDCTESGWSDNRTSDANDWCRSRYDSSSSMLYCDDDGPSGTLCCEYDGDGFGDGQCDYESICFGGVDEDDDNLYDCGDPDCDGLPCNFGKSCQSGSCQPY